jgi:hypothetical protein
VELSKNEAGLCDKEELEGAIETNSRGALEKKNS